MPKCVIDLIAAAQAGSHNKSHVPLGAVLTNQRLSDWLQMFSAAVKKASQDTTRQMSRCVFCHRRGMRIVPGDFKYQLEANCAEFNQTAFLGRFLKGVLWAGQMITEEWML